MQPISLYNDSARKWFNTMCLIQNQININQSLFGTDLCPYIMRASFYISIYLKFCSFRLSKTFVSFIRTSGKYLTSTRVCFFSGLILVHNSTLFNTWETCSAPSWDAGGAPPPSSGSSWAHLKTKYYIRCSCS